MSSRLNPDAGIAAILARAARADAAEARRLEVAIDDFFLPQEGRRDDETRAAVAAHLAVAVEAIERELSFLSERADAAPLVRGVPPRLLASRLLRDGSFMAELIAAARQELLAPALGERAAVRPVGPARAAVRLLRRCGRGGGRGRCFRRRTAEPGCRLRCTGGLSGGWRRRSARRGAMSGRSPMRRRGVSRRQSRPSARRGGDAAGCGDRHAARRARQPAGGGARPRAPGAVHRRSRARHGARLRGVARDRA